MSASVAQNPSFPPPEGTRRDKNLLVGFVLNGKTMSDVQAVCRVNSVFQVKEFFELVGQLAS